MGLEQGAFVFGEARYPLTMSRTNTLLQDADPALYHAAKLIASAIHTYVGDRLLAEAEAVGLRLPSAVVAVETIEPTPFLLADQFKFPLLCLYRSEDVWDEKTIAYSQSTSTWEFAYILPAMQPAQVRALQPILRAVSATLRRVVRMGTDPSYEAGLAVWKTAGIHRASVVSAKYGGFEYIDQNDRFFRALTGKITVLERESNALSEYDDFDGIDGTVGVVGDAGPADLLEPVVEIETHHAPTFTSLTPTSGDATGGDLVTITGTGFRLNSRPSVLFDGAAADAVTVVNATTITCITPPHAAYPSVLVDVVIVAADGQTASLEEAFTFNA